MSFNFDVSIDQLKDVISTDKHVIVAFNDPDCEPCAIMGPIFMSLIPVYDQKISICTFNAVKTTQHKVFGSSFKVIKEIPTFITFKDGLLYYISGETKKEELIKLIDEVLDE
jgi:thioredoxin-like negative regulator of GroEL